MECRERLGRALFAVVVAVLALGIAALAPAVATASVAKTALINEDSITTEDGITKEGAPISLEQFAAENAGFKVTVASGKTWEEMTPAQFAQYQVLIIGDPICAETPKSAINSAPTWAPVVMNTAEGGANPGNRAVVGTDPEDHYKYGNGGAAPKAKGEPATAGAEHLVQDGIAFAGGVEGATGVYFDTSCEDPSQADVGVFNMLKSSTAAGEWVESNTEPNCKSPVAQIATNPVFNSGPTKLTDEDINGWECSSHVSFIQFPSDWTALAITIPLEHEVRPTPVCGSDIETGQPKCGQAYVLVAGRGIVAKAPNLTLTPETHSDLVGGTHTVVANAHDNEGKPIVGTKVSFVVTETNAGVTGTCTFSNGTADPECLTDEKGEVDLTYSDVHGVGKDTILGSITLETKFEESEIEAKPTATKVVTVKTTERATATEEWTAPPPPPPAPKPVTVVLAEKVVKTPAGSASASRVVGCLASSSYLAAVHGSQIESVRFTLDGHTIGTVKHASSSGLFSLRVRLKAGKRHHLSMHVTFTAASKTAAATINRTLARCAAAKPVAKPRFTG